MSDECPAPNAEREKARGAAEWRRLAQKIAERLFTNGQGRRADRLVLRRDVPPFDLGGWCFKAAMDQIQNVLRGD